MNVRDILQLPVFENATLVAGDAGQHREVQHINMMDAPDIVDFLKENDLLVTTAYHFREDTSSLMDVIEQMALQGCAGLGVKTKRFLSKIPNEAIQLANDLSFPIIELPSDVRLGTIVNQTLSSILNIRTNELKNAIESHQMFTEHIMSGKGLKRLLESVSDIVNQPVYLLDQHSKLINSSHISTPVMEQIEALHKSGYQFFLPKTTYTCFTLLMEENKHQDVTVFPIYTHETKCGSLVVLGDIPLSNSGVILTIEQATNVIAFELMKKNALKQYARRARNEFFINYVDGSFSSKEEITSRAREFDLQNEQKYICVAGKLDQDEKTLSFRQNQMEIDTVFEFLEEELYSFPFSSHMFIKGNMAVILIEVHDRSIDSHTPLLYALEDVQDSVYNQFQRTLSFGVSNICHQFLDVQDAFTEAADALQTGQLSGNIQFIQAYQTKDITELLRIIPTEDLREFCSYTLQKLSEPQYKDQSLLHTLSVYLETHCQISETAKRLYVHRNTVIYRLEKIEDLIGQDLKDPDTTLRLRLALRIQTSMHV